MSKTMTYSETLTVTHCWCGIALAIPSSLFDNAYNHGQDVYCPLGHKFGWTDTEAKRLRRQLDEREQQLARERSRRDQAEAEARHQEARANGYKGAATKARKRAAKGVCPAAGCKRSFVDVARHVKTCHPELAEAEVVRDA